MLTKERTLRNTLKRGLLPIPVQPLQSLLFRSDAQGVDMGVPVLRGKGWC